MKKPEDQIDRNLREVLNKGNNAEIPKSSGPIKSFIKQKKEEIAAVLTSTVLQYPLYTFLVASALAGGATVVGIKMMTATSPKKEPIKITFQTPSSSQNKSPDTTTGTKKESSGGEKNAQLSQDDKKQALENKKNSAASSSGNDQTTEKTQDELEEEKIQEILKKLKETKEKMDAEQHAEFMKELEKWKKEFEKMTEFFEKKIRENDRKEAFHKLGLFGMNATNRRIPSEPKTEALQVLQNLYREIVMRLQTLAQQSTNIEEISVIVEKFINFLKVNFPYENPEDRKNYPVEIVNISPEKYAEFAGDALGARQKMLQIMEKKLEESLGRTKMFVTFDYSLTDKQGRFMLKYFISSKTLDLENETMDVLERYKNIHKNLPEVEKHRIAVKLLNEYEQLKRKCFQKRQSTQQWHASLPETHDTEKKDKELVSKLQKKLEWYHSLINQRGQEMINYWEKSLDAAEQVAWREKFAQ